jgi:hypothetical protein
MEPRVLVREAVGVFDTVEDMEAAIDELQTSGFNRALLSLLASETAVQEKLGHALISTRDLEDNPDAPYVAYLARESFGSIEGYAIGGLLYVGAIAGFAPILASGGSIGAAIIAAALVGGGGGAIGSVFATMIEKHHADFLENQLQHGGILLWVRTKDKEHEKRAIDILSRHSAKDVHIHGIPDESERLSDYYIDQSANGAVSDIKSVYYRDVQIALAKDGHCYAYNRLFISETQAQQYIDMIQAEE